MDIVNFIRLAQSTQKKVLKNTDLFMADQRLFGEFAGAIHVVAGVRICRRLLLTFPLPQVKSFRALP